MSMTDKSENLDALTFPLYGSRLIEASAGTGKTYTIAALYLRLILGHGSDNAFHAPLLPTQILVATFTDAAASELRERIRARLVDMSSVLREERAGDPLAQALFASIPASERQNRAQWLELAAGWMDEAVISTIHGWCQRMLREHAFDSRSLFNLTLQTDHSELLAEVTRDYWRGQCYPLQGEALDWVMRHWQTPDALYKQLTDLLKEDAPPPDSALKPLLDAALRQRAQILTALKAPWREWADELESLLDAAVDAGQVDARKIQARYYKPWLQKLRDWRDSAEAELDLGAGFTRLTPEGLREAWKGNAPHHLALDAMLTLPQQLAALPDPTEAALRHAAAWTRDRFTEEKSKRAEIGFDDMLTRLDAALKNEDGTDGSGERLARVIRQQFPVALIDEFQDTDPLQYRIFDRIYHVANPPLSPVEAAQGRGGTSGLFMIGDPKQAIYSFRGADIHTYLSARNATAGRHYKLDTNFRSSADMVAAVNHLFQQAEDRGGDGAFGFGEELPFDKVNANGKNEVWTLDNQAQTALTVWHLPTEKAIGKGRYVQAMADYAAEEIARLLTLGQQGRAGFSRDGQLTKLQPNDIAVLVRDGNEASAIREQLSRRGVQSVYLSDRDSVFDSQEARDLRLWLSAVAAPENDRALRAALASQTLNLDLAELAALTRDERQWEARVIQFREYRQCWLKQGVLPMLRRLLHQFKLPATLSERALTNLLHLSELLQQAAAELDGEQALIRHLDERLNGEQRGDEQVLRLESDAALVRVITIYKAKGLEYQLVFLPFICAFRPLEGKKPFVARDDEDRRRTIFHADAITLANARRERLGEDLRLLYVALTRARHACWLGVANLNIRKNDGEEHSALDELLDVPRVPLAEALQSLRDAPGSRVLDIAERATATRYQTADNALTAPVWRTPRRRAAAENWWIASYSALRQSEATNAQYARHDDAAPESLSMQNASDDDSNHAAGLSPVPRHLTPDTLHRFPRGTNPGTFLHGLLEIAAAEGFADTPTLRDQIARRCQRRGWKQWINPLTDWLLALLQQPLPLGDGRSARLVDLKCSQPEMEFWFETHHVDAGKLDEWVRQYECAGLPRPGRGKGDILNGMFKGFIDLTFEHEGRYYVADYKSNWLGADDAAYTPDALRNAMLEHRYDLQYTLYLLALHRQLKLRLPDYDYDRHMGGALYLFLRAPAAQGVYLARPPRTLIESLDALFQGKDVGVEARGAA